MNKNVESGKTFTITLNENAGKRLTKYLNKCISAIESQIKDHEEMKLKSEFIINHAKLNKGNDEPNTLADILGELFGVNPVKEAEEFLDHYEKCVSGMRDDVQLFEHVILEIKSQFTKSSN